MEEKKLKINIPEGYEIDKEKSTFEEIVFKKVEDPLAKLPKTWKEYRNCTRRNTSYFLCNPLESIKVSSFSGVYNEFSTEERVKQYVALGKLLQLRDYWVKGYSEFRYALFGTKDGISLYGYSGFSAYPLAFPTKEMAKEFKNCFEDLIKEAYPLI